MKKFLSLYLPSFPTAIAYMLQASEYEYKSYLKWLRRTDDFTRVMHRRSLDMTSVARAFVLFVRLGVTGQMLIAVFLLVFGWLNDQVYAVLGAVIAVMIAPVLWAFLVVIPLVIAKKFIIDKRMARQRAQTSRILNKHPGMVIAVAGSYGKTTMKEILATVLSESKKVASTPGNKNVETAHYDFAKSLQGEEDVLIIEFGEGRPGDVKQFTDTIKPDLVVITGLAPAHLDNYGSLIEAGTDIFSAAQSVAQGDAYVNAESDAATYFMQPSYVQFDDKGVHGWSVSDIKVDLQGTRFKLHKDDRTLSIHSGLIGRHLVGVLAAAADIADRLGLTPKQIEAGMALTKPYEHRMQPYNLSGAWIIDDSYNGNIQGVSAGTELLKNLDAKRKIYITPGLVEQGEDTESIHNTMGTLIADAKPDIVVLMHNSVTKYIQSGLQSKNYDGEIIIQDDPLRFYSNLDQFVAAGDVVMLQNDWTDNYQ